MQKKKKKLVFKKIKQTINIGRFQIGGQLTSYSGTHLNQVLATNKRTQQ